MTVESTNHNCIKFWEDEKEEVINVLRVATADRQDAEHTKTNLTLWEASLKEYWEKIEETDKKAKSCAVEIGRFKTSTTRIKELTTTTVSVTNMAYCMIIDFFKSMDKLKDKISGLLKEIECLNNPDINAKSSIVMGNITELKTNLDLAISTQADTIKNALAILEYARDLDKAIGNTDGTNPPDQSGLLWLLKKLNGLFDTSAMSAPAEGEGTSYGEGCHQPEMPCDAKIEPKPKMPLDQDDYYKKTKDQYEKAKSEQDSAEAALTAAKEWEDKLISSKNSLEKAITKAKAAKGC